MQRGTILMRTGRWHEARSLDEAEEIVKAWENVTAAP